MEHLRWESVQFTVKQSKFIRRNNSYPKIYSEAWIGGILFGVQDPGIDAEKWQTLVCAHNKSLTLTMHTKPWRPTPSTTHTAVHLFLPPSRSSLACCWAHVAGAI